MGRQAEACFKAYLNSSANYDILVSNLQINASTSLSNSSEKRTLGELDYIVKNKNSEIVHIELACKFYLFDENAGITIEEKWIGPNRKDSLFDKLEKTKLKQFPLLNEVETKEKLTELNIPFPTNQKLCLKAFLFLPKNLKAENLPENYRDCVVGYYSNFDDFMNENTDAVYAIPIKKEWLLPLEFITQWYTFSEIKPMIEEQIKNKKSPLLYKKTNDKIEKFFVVWW